MGSPGFRNNGDSAQKWKATTEPLPPYEDDDISSRVLTALCDRLSFLDHNF